MDKEKQSLLECLTWCSLKELPKEDDGKDIYIAAVIKVRKADTTVSYAAVKRDVDGTDKIIKDFGTCAVIREVPLQVPQRRVYAEAERLHAEVDGEFPCADDAADGRGF